MKNSGTHLPVDSDRNSFRPGKAKIALELFEGFRNRLFTAVRAGSANNTVVQLFGLVPGDLTVTREGATGQIDDAFRDFTAKSARNRSHPLPFFRILGPRLPSDLATDLGDLLGGSYLFRDADRHRLYGRTRPREPARWLDQ